MKPASWSSRRGWLGAAAAMLAAAGGAGLVWRRLQAINAVEDAFWQQQFDRPDGARLAMAGFRGRPMLLNFWATWCPPCRQELPLLNAFFEAHRAAGWQVLGVAVDETDAVRRFLGARPLAYPVVMAGYAGIGLGRAFGNEEGGLPFTVVFDASGRQRDHKIGRLDAPDLDRWLNMATA